MVATRATKNASLSGAKKGEATSTAIRCAPSGSLSSSGWASQPYSVLANGSSPRNTTISPATARSRRVRSSTRCSIRVASPALSASIPIRALLAARGRIGRTRSGCSPVRRRRWRRGSRVRRRLQRLVSFAGGVAHGVMDLLQLAPGLLAGGAERRFGFAHCILGFLQAALELVGRHLAFEFAAHRIPLRPRPAYPQAREARSPGQPLRPQHDQRNNRDQDQFGKTDIKHGAAAAAAASAPRVFVLLRIPLGVGFALLVLEMAGRPVLVRVAHALLEALDGLPQVTTGAAQALGAEDEEHDHQHDDPMPDAESAHSVAEIPSGRGWSGYRSRRCCGSRAVVAAVQIPSSSGSLRISPSPTGSNGCGSGCSCTWAGCGLVPIAVAPGCPSCCAAAAGAAAGWATGTCCSVPRSARAMAVASSSLSRKSTTASEGCCAVRPSKIMRGVVPGPYTAWLAASSMLSTAPSRATPANRPRARDHDQISACSWPSVAVAAWRPSGPAATPTSAPRVSLPLTMLSRLRSLRNTITTSADCTPACRPMLPPVRRRNAGADQVPSGVFTDITPCPRRPPMTRPALTVSGTTTIARAS